MEFTWDAPASFSEVLECCGRIPIPPYLNRESEEDDKIRYQTVYSKNEGSVAAPTAGLHFSIPVLKALREKGITIEELTLHVGGRDISSREKRDYQGARYAYGTYFRSAGSRGASMYSPGKYYCRGNNIRPYAGKPLLDGRETNFWEMRISVRWGSGRLYDLPSGYSLKESMTALLGWFDEQDAELLKAKTTIIIVPGYSYRVITAMFTNFHQPQSTLLLLVAAAIGEDWHKVYDYALTHDFRF